ncbi:MAG TPA: hypothetical protein DCW42_06035 [Bacteroidetes bacterium]|nr:hypothetical protein [Bacteroidota bacterium]
MPWDFERVIVDGVEYIEAFHTDNPDDRFQVYKFLPSQQIIEFYPKASDGFPITKITLEGFIYLPGEFSEAGYIRGVSYYLSSKLREKNVISLMISKTQEDSIRKVKNKDEYQMVLNYSSFQKIRRSQVNIASTAKKDRRASIDYYFNNIFPNHYEKKLISGSTRSSRLISLLEESVIEYLNPAQVKKILDFVETLLKTRYKSTSSRWKLFGAAKIKVDEVALNEVILIFEKLIEESPPESKWGDFLKKNLFLVESKYIKLISELNVVLAGSRNVDFGLIDSQGYLDLFEIKKPNTKLLAGSTDRGNYYWNSEAIKAITQAEKYLYNAERKAPELKEDITRELDINVKVVRPRAVVIMGHSNQLDNEKKREDFRILRMSLKNVEIVLYDELLERLKNQRKKIYIENLNLE